MPTALDQVLFVTILLAPPVAVLLGALSLLIRAGSAHEAAEPERAPTRQAHAAH